MRRRFSINVYLLAMVLAAMLPLVALMAWNEYHEILEDVEEERRALARRVAFSAERLDDFLREVKGHLAWIASRSGPGDVGMNPDLRPSGVPGCGHFLAHVLDVHPEYLNAVVFDADGGIACAGRALSEAERSAWGRDARRGSASGGDGVFQVLPFRAGEASAPGVLFGTPLRGAAGEHRGAVALLIPLERFGRFAWGPNPAPGPVFTIVDAGGTVVSRSAEAESWVGRDARGREAVDAAIAAGFGIAEGRSATGAEMVFAFARLREADWRVVAGLPAATIDAKAEQDVRSLLAAALAMVLAGMVMSTLLARRIAVPVRGLAAAARAARDGRAAAPPLAGGPAEMAAVASELNDVLARRAAAETALRDANTRLSGVIEGTPDLIAVVDADLRFLLANSAYAAEFQRAYGRVPVAGTSLPELLDGAEPGPAPDSDTGFERLDDWRRALAGEEVAAQREIGSGGEARVFEVACHPLREPGGRRIGAAAFLRDITQRARMEQALKESEGKYRRLVELANDAIFVIDAETGLIVEANARAASMLGLPLERIVGMHEMQLHPPEQAEYYRELFFDSLRSGRRLLEDLVVCAADGRRVPVDVSVIPVEASGRRLVFGLFRDMSERVRADMLLASEQHSLWMIVENRELDDILDYLCRSVEALAPHGKCVVMLADEPGGALRVASCRSLPDGFCELLSALPADAGWPCGGEPGGALVVPDLAAEPRFAALAPQAAVYGIRAAWALPVVDAAGATLGALCTFYPEPGEPASYDRGLVQRAIHVVEIAVERSRAVRRLHESEVRFRALTEHALDVISVIDADARELYHSQAVELLVGYRPEERIGRSVLELVHPEDLQAITETLGRILREPGRLYSVEARVRRRDGGWRTVETLAKNCLDDPAVRGIVLNSRDVTDSREARAALLRNTVRLEILNGIAAGIISRSPLDRIVGPAVERLQGHFGRLWVAYWAAAPDSGLRLDHTAGPGQSRWAGPPAIERHEAAGYLAGLPQDGADAIRDAPGEAALGPLAEILFQAGVRAALHAPVRHGSELGGVLAVYGPEPRAWASDDIAMVAEVARYLAVAVQEGRSQEERARAEFALRESEARFDRAVRGSDVGIWDWDLSADRVYYSPGFRRLLGYGDEPFDFVFRDALHPEDRHGALTRLFASLERHQPFETEFRLRHRDGGYRWFHGRGRVFPGSDGRVSHFAGAVVDITGLKRAEAALMEREERLKLVLDGTDDALWDWDLPTDAVEYSPRWAEMLGFEAAELEPTVTFWRRRVHPEDAPRAAAVLEEHLAGRSALYASEYRLRRKAGDWLWVLARGKVARRDSHGRPLRMTGTVSDITERRRAEEQLRLAAQVFESAGEAIAVTDRDNRIIAVNPAFTGITGYAPAEAIGRNPRMLSSGRHGQAFYCAMWDSIARDGRWDGEIWNRRRSGEVFPEWLAICAVRDATGQVTNYIAIFADITERKRAETEVRRLNAELERRVVERTAQLEASNRELESFSYSVSHDLRAPLRAIGGFSQILVERYSGQLDETGRDYLRRVQVGCQRMAGLIDDLLALSRITRGDISLARVDLSALAAQVGDQLAEAEPARAVGLAVESGMTAFADPRLLRIAMENLLGNAWKFTSRTPDPRIEVGWARDGAEVVYRVRDNGAGFDMRFADKLFAPFQRLHRIDEFEGTGIGLATVSRIVHRHGGRIWAAAEPGRGAAFFFTLGAANDGWDHTAGG